MSNVTTVGISDMKMIRNSGSLVTYALGSCIGICLYEPNIKLAGMVHILLPAAPPNDTSNIFKYADTAIDETIRKMEVFGANKRNMIAKIAGGAKMFSVPGNSDFGNIGMRNSEAVQSSLQKHGIVIKGKDVGGTVARTLFLDAENGTATIKTFGQPEKKM